MRVRRDDDYERREREKFQRELREIERAALADRRESCRAFFEAMRDNPDLVGERIGWLLDGSYGRGAHIVAHEVIRRPRMNRVAWLTSTVGAVEWRCPLRMVQQAWNRLSASEKSRLQRAVDREISQALAEGSNGTSGDRARRRRASPKRASSRDSRGRDSVREQAKRRAAHIQAVVGASARGARGVRASKHSTRSRSR